MPDPDILSAARKYRMFRPGEKVLVAVSGGPDSVAMLHALLAHSSEFGFEVHAAHLNHGIRGEASDLDAEFVRSLAHNLGVPVTIEKADVPALREAMRVGEEEAAREARYEFLRRAAREIGAGRIAVGHTADDRAESVLLNVIRGTGVEGLGSIRPARGEIVRPMIDAWRSDVEVYIRQHALPFRIDESNLDTTYTRNRIRRELIPLIEREYNPRARSALVRLARIAASESDLAEEMTQSAIRHISYRGALDAGLLIDLPEALHYGVVRAEILRLKGDLKDVAFEQVERVIEALHSGEDFTIALPSGAIYATRRGDLFRVWRREEEAEIEPFEIELAVPGRTVIPRLGVAIDAEMIERPGPVKMPRDAVLIDADAVAGPLRARNVRPGDRIVPFGMTGSKKLQDVFVDRKVARPERARAVVVEDDKRILWVVGVVASEAARVTDRTRGAIRLTAARDL